MTSKEAIEQLQNCKGLIQQDGQDYLDERDIPLLDMAIEALKADVARWSSWNKTFEQSEIADLISRADAVNTLETEKRCTDRAEDVSGLTLAKFLISALPSADAYTEQEVRDAYNCGYSCGQEQMKELLSADAVQGYTEWLEKIIVEAETLEWLCEDATDEEWCEKNCNYASIQAKCLRHLYAISKGGEQE